MKKSLFNATAEKTGKYSVMKFLIIFFCTPFLLFGESINTHITFTGEPMVGLRTIIQSFSAAGYQFDTDSFSVENHMGELNATVTSNKVFSPPLLAENLQEQGIGIIKAHFDPHKGLSLVLDTENAYLNVVLLGSDEGSELKKVNVAQWFRVEETQNIRIEPPYTGKWYPEIAVFDHSMGLISSFRSMEAKEEFQFELPKGAYYLKISNAQGMKVLKEGMWIESLSVGR